MVFARLELGRLRAADAEARQVEGDKGWVHAGRGAGVYVLIQG
jgi:hypothetical protein